LPAIKETQKRDVMPEEILADFLYGSDDNIATRALTIKYTAWRLAKRRAREKTDSSRRSLPSIPRRRQL
jgi:hypothetical protein